MVHDVRRELVGDLFAIGRQYHEVGWRRPEAALKLSPVHHMHGHYCVSLAECGRRLYPAEYRHCKPACSGLRCPLAETDPELAAALDGELVRQQDGIELIARENAVSARSSWRRKDRC
jgi:hypothetical protein